VQPPINILDDTLTTKDNDALKVSPDTHLKGVIRKGSQN